MQEAGKEREEKEVIRTMTTAGKTVVVIDGAVMDFSYRGDPDPDRKYVYMAYTELEKEKDDEAKRYDIFVTDEMMETWERPVLVSIGGKVIRPDMAAAGLADAGGIGLVESIDSVTAAHATRWQANAGIAIAAAGAVMTVAGMLLGMF